MSRRTREINRITTAIITISIKLMVLALLILLLYEAVVRGFAFGHEIFYAEAAEAAPGREITVEIKEGETAKEAAGELKKKGLITNDFAFWFQSIFYDYQDIYPGIYTLNTSMTSKEILRELNVKPEEESEASPEAPHGEWGGGSLKRCRFLREQEDQSGSGRAGRRGYLYGGRGIRRLDRRGRGIRHDCK